MLAQDTLVRLRKEGLTYRVIAERLGINPSTLRHYAHRMGLTEPVRTAWPRWMIRRALKMRKQGKSYREIARAIGKNNGATVQAKLRKLNNG